MQELTVGKALRFRKGAGGADPLADFTLGLSEPFNYADGELAAVSGIWLRSNGFSDVVNSRLETNGLRPTPAGGTYTTNAFFIARNIDYAVKFTMPLTAEVDPLVNSITVGWGPSTLNSSTVMIVNRLNNTQYHIQARNLITNTILTAVAADGASRDFIAIWRVNGSVYDAEYYFNGQLIGQLAGVINTNATPNWTPRIQTFVDNNYNQPRGVDLCEFYTA